MESVPATVPAESWVSDPASALSDTVANLAGIAHAHPMLGWLGAAYLALLVVGKKVELPPPYGTILHAFSNLAWMLTSSKVQNQSDVQALTHSAALSTVLGMMKTMGGDATIQDLEARITVTLHEPLRTEVLKLLHDPGAVLLGETALNSPAATPPSTLIGK